MSVDLNVFLARNRMPTPERWAEAIRQAGFRADLDTDFDVDSSSGFRPCAYDGKPAGFEYYAGRLADEDRAGADLPPEYDFSVMLATHSDMREFASSVVAAAVLCVLSGGRLSDPQAGVDVDASGALAWARTTLEEIAADLRAT